MLAQLHNLFSLFSSGHQHQLLQAWGTHAILHGGGFHWSGCPNIQSDQTLMLGSSSLRSKGNAETRTIPSNSSPLQSCSTSSMGTGFGRENDTRRLKTHQWNKLNNKQWNKNFLNSYVYVPAGVSLSSSVQRCTRSANMPRPRAVLCSCKTDLTSPSSPDKKTRIWKCIS